MLLRQRLAAWLWRARIHEAAVVGETPNLASRLRALASPGQIIIAKSTRRLLDDVFDLVDLSVQTVQGIREPVQAFAVTGARPVESRFDARSGPAPLPMVGRDQELALLLERWALAEAGEGQACCWSERQGSASPGSSGRCSTRWPLSRTTASATSARPTTPTARFGR